MTRFDPSIKLNRLLVQKDDRFVYDEEFHSGVNIIRGDNSSGKSTVLNFIFYVLGGDVAQWSETALLCTSVIAEVEFNGIVATLRRFVSPKNGQPMEIFGGPWEKAKTAGMASWKRYPYARTQSLESFSQALFRLLDIPEAISDSTGNLTMHQIMRLLYADQLSPVESLFLFDKRWDTPTIRDAVGRLLCGVKEADLYANELKIRSLQKNQTILHGEHDSLVLALGVSAENLTIEWVDLQKESTSKDYHQLQLVIDTKLIEVNTDATSQIYTLDAQNKAYNETKKAMALLTDKQAEIDNLTLSIVDTQKFISDLEAKLKALKDSALTAEVIGDVTFQTCPACYQPLEKQPIAHACHLCKQPFENKDVLYQIAELINETSLQIKQAAVVQQNREKKYSTLSREINELKVMWSTHKTELEQIKRSPTTVGQDELRELYTRVGYLQKEIEEYDRLAGAVKKVEELKEKLSEIASQITDLTNQNRAIQRQQQNRISIAYTEIGDEIKTLLRNDLNRQHGFENPEIIDFDFGANTIRVDNKSYFSASSRVILKTSFFIGFLAAALKKSFFNHPRFCIIDTIEDKGMEPTRSQNFQREIVRVSETSGVENQVIFATAMIDPSLNNEKYCVGKHATRSNYTLDIL
ncbi:Chromosome partition protein Smc [Pseudovibrio sp. W64]|uniref:AAA family ATPase n=1 Tax=Pseudovibrio sp. W64 TaxID=1735583 RepID=UPI0007AE4A84|nr:AAA family ATPase [Pseudovibrio sp. W64]KZK81813.1 Chromosome partition protein Smc [Pseudovibrio sp. W64]